jgi:hypothetical protein
MERYASLAGSRVIPATVTPLDLPEVTMAKKESIEVLEYGDSRGLGYDPAWFDLKPVWAKFVHVACMGDDLVLFIKTNRKPMQAFRLIHRDRSYVCAAISEFDEADYFEDGGDEAEGTGCEDAMLEAYGYEGMIHNEAERETALEEIAGRG